MADAQVGILIKARDEASGVLNKLSGGVTNLQGALGDMAKSAGAFGLIAAGAVAAGAAAIAAVSKIANAVEELDRIAYSTGTTIEQLQAVKEIVTQGGGDFASVTASMNKLNKAMADGEPLAKRLGLSTTDTFTAYKQLAEVLTGIQDPITRNGVAMKLLGKSYAEVLPDMKAIVENGDAMMESLKATDGLLTGETAEAARKADAAFDQLGQTWRALSVSLTTLIVPAVTVFLKAVNAMLGAIAGWVKAVKDGTVGILGDLSKAAADSETYAERIEKAKERVRKEYGGKGNVQVGVPTMAGIEVSAKRGAGLLDEPDKETPREKRLRSIMEVMRASKDLAERYLKSLEALEGSKAREAMTKQLQEANALPLPGPAMPDAPTRGGGRIVAPEDPAKVAADEELADKAVRALIKNMQTLKETMKEVGDGWRTTAQDILSMTSVVDAGFSALWNGLQSGFQQVFAGLMQKGQTLKSAMVTLFRSLASEVLAELARIAAAKVFLFLLNFLVPGLGSAAGGAASAGGVFVARAPAGPTNSLVVNINAMDKSGVAASLMDPRGELRYAVNQMQMARAQ